MKQRFFALCTFIFLGVGAFGQEFMVITGLQNNLYFDFLDGNYYQSKSSISAFVGLQYLHYNTTKDKRILLGMNYQKYSSYEKHRYGGLSGTRDSTYFNKSVLKFDFQPFGLCIAEHTYLNFGVGIEYLLSEVFSTYRSSWNMNTGQTIISNPYTEANSSYSHRIVPLITGTLGTQFDLGKQLHGIFQYQFSLSITPELKYGNAFKSFWMLGLSIPLKEK
ncbi:MAG: hypothetical protein ACKOWW_06800 [Flavobacteriales bacterium]